MNDFPTPKKPDRAQVAKIVAAAALTLLAVTNVAWLMAYSSLSQRVVGVTSPGPSVSSTPRLSTSPTPTPPTTGDIAGTLSYPGEEIPAMTVCAVSTTDASKNYCVDHKPGTAATFTLSAPRGTYYVYASLKVPQGDFTTSYKAYYNKHVTCQAAGNCAPGLHTQYVPVTVTDGMTIDSINPTDWYALGVGQ
jgi:hypothetical protein